MYVPPREHYSLSGEGELLTASILILEPELIEPALGCGSPFVGSAFITSSPLLGAPLHELFARLALGPGSVRAELALITTALAAVAAEIAIRDAAFEEVGEPGRGSQLG